MALPARVKDVTIIRTFKPVRGLFGRVAVSAHRNSKFCSGEIDLNAKENALAVKEIMFLQLPGRHSTTSWFR